MILARILRPRSKLATARCPGTESLTHTLGEEFGVEDAGEDELYRAVDEWHLPKALAPLLFEDNDPEGARAKRDTPVQKAEPSDSAKRKTASKTTPEGLPVQPDTRFMVTSGPTELQAKAFALLDLPPEPRVYNRLTV